MYSLLSYGKMIRDRGRMAAYAQALQQTVKPGSIVVDIGTGTGIFALLACQLGAKQVYAIEPDRAIAVAKEIATANGYSDRVCFIQKNSTQVELPHRADVIVSDLRGVLPFFGEHLPSIIDARERLLAPNGVLIPLRDRVWATIVEAPQLYEQYTSPWDENPYDLQLQAAKPFVTNTWRKGKITPEQCLLAPQPRLTLDYTCIEDANGTVEFAGTISRRGIAHGICLWFDATLTEKIGFSNAPGQPELIYGQAFFPWKTPVPVEPRDRVSVKLQANWVHQDYIWRWHSQIFHQGQSTQLKANFEQSTFWSQPLSSMQLHKQAHAFVPALNPDGKILQAILQLMSEQQSLGEIARHLTAQFPEMFPTWQLALRRVGELSQQYSL